MCVCVAPVRLPRHAFRGTPSSSSPRRAVLRPCLLLLLLPLPGLSADHMGWEARLFYRPLPEQAFVNVLASLSLATAEERTDLYLPHSPGAGLKLRGGDSWEVKLRVETDDRGFEKWKKHHCESEEKAVAVAGPSGVAADAPKVSVQKRRLQTSVGGCLVEQTDLLVSCGGATEEWRTVAIEGKRKACAPLLQELLLACAAQADPAHGAVRSCGYPEFVCEVAGRLSSGTRSGAAEPPATAECEVAEGGGET